MVLTRGIRTLALPSLGIEVASVLLQVLPLSVDRRMRTFRASFLVLLTFHSMTAPLPALSVFSPRASDVTWNGPVFLSIRSVTSS